MVSGLFQKIHNTYNSPFFSDNRDFPTLDPEICSCMPATRGGIDLESHYTVIY